MIYFLFHRIGEIESCHFEILLVYMSNGLTSIIRNIILSNSQGCLGKLKKWSVKIFVRKF